MTSVQSRTAARREPPVGQTDGTLEMKRNVQLSNIAAREIARSKYGSTELVQRSQPEMTGAQPGRWEIPSGKRKSTHSLNAGMLAAEHVKLRNPLARAAGQIKFSTPLCLGGSVKIGAELAKAARPPVTALRVNNRFLEAKTRLAGESTVLM